MDACLGVKQLHDMLTMIMVPPRNEIHQTTNNAMVLLSNLPNSMMQLQVAEGQANQHQTGCRRRRLRRTSPRYRPQNARAWRWHWQLTKWLHWLWVNINGQNDWCVTFVMINKPVALRVWNLLPGMQHGFDQRAQKSKRFTNLMLLSAMDDQFKMQHSENFRHYWIE